MKIKPEYFFVGHIFDSSGIELLSEFEFQFSRISNLTFTFPQTRNKIGYSLASMFPSAKLIPTSNRGRDFYPFQQALQSIDAKPTDLVIKWHDKRRNQFSDLSLLFKERKNLLEYCLPRNTGETPPLLVPFTDDQEVSLSTIAGWLIPLGLRLGGNSSTLNRFSQEEGWSWDDVKQNSMFPAGGIFAAKYQVFKGSKWLNSESAQIEYGHGGLDGTWAHASERWVGVLAARKGKLSEVIFK
jgi:hypothetical protein